MDKFYLSAKLGWLQSFWKDCTESEWILLILQYKHDENWLKGIVVLDNIWDW